MTDIYNLYHHLESGDWDGGWWAAGPDSLHARLVFIHTNFSSGIELILALELYTRGVWASEGRFIIPDTFDLPLRSPKALPSTTQSCLGSLYLSLLVNGALI